MRGFLLKPVHIWSVTIPVVAVAAVGLLVVGGTVYGYGRYQASADRQAAEARELADLKLKAQNLLGDYKSCVKDHGTDSKRCQAIKTEQMATAAEHNRRAGL